MSEKTSFRINLITAMMFLLFAGWNAYVDATLGSHLILQSSWAMPLLSLFVFTWFVAGMIFACLPKRILIPAAIPVLLRSSMGWPLSVSSGIETACHILNVVNVVIAVGYFIWILTRPQRLRVEHWFRLRHTIIAFTAWLILNVASVFTTALGFATVIDELTHGYVQVTLRGFTFAERVFEKDNHRVHLIGLSHIGEGEFYKDLKESFREPTSGGRLILTEGVTDKEEVLPEGFKTGKTYGNLASQLGLEEQKNFQSGSGSGKGPSWKDLGVTFKHADIDISELDPSHLDLLVEVLEAMGSKSLIQSFIASASIEVEASEMESFFVDGLIGQRNDYLMEVFHSNYEDFDETYIPWGAAHLPDLERRLLADGFAQVAEKKRVGIAFGR